MILMICTSKKKKYCGVGGWITYWALGPVWGGNWSEDKQAVQIVLGQTLWTEHGVEGRPRRNVSSDLLRVGQTPDLMIKATLQDALMTRTYPRNVQERRKPQRKNIIYLKKNCCHRIKCTTTTFLATFMWRRLWIVIPWQPRLTESQGRCQMGQVLK